MRNLRASCMMESAYGVDVHRDLFCGWENPDGSLLWVCTSPGYIEVQLRHAARSLRMNEQGRSTPYVITKMTRSSSNARKFHFHKHIVLILTTLTVYALITYVLRINTSTLLRAIKRYYARGCSTPLRYRTESNHEI